MPYCLQPVAKGDYADRHEINSIMVNALAGPVDVHSGFKDLPIQSPGSLFAFLIFPPLAACAIVLNPLNRTDAAHTPG